MRNWIISGRAFLSQRQGSILSAAFVVMGMVVAARLVGVVKQRVLAHYFPTSDISIYLAAFFPSDTLLEILVTGSLAVAFIPIFSGLLGRQEKEKVWQLTSIIQNNLLIIFSVLAILVFILAPLIISILTPGFSLDKQATVVALARFLLIGQTFFLLSYFLTGSLESFGRFLVPALAPLFYNLGVIAGTIFLSSFWIWGPAIGAVIGASLHFLIQLPLARSLGFKFYPRVNLRDPNFIKVVILALPLMVVTVFSRVSKGVELSFATLIASGAYAQFVFANSLQSVPVALFGNSFAKVALPTLSMYASRRDNEQFSRTFAFVIGQILFFIAPVAVTIAVLRIPLTRLVFGAQEFTWGDTVQTGLTLSAFAVGIVAQAMIVILSRSFYALQNTRIPMMLSLGTILINIFLIYLFIKYLGFGVWGIALSFSVASILQMLILFILLNGQIRVLTSNFLISVIKILLASGISGGVMFLLIKVFDQAAWDKRLSFLGELGLALPTGFERFVLDTRYTMNLIFLTALVMTVGIFVYLLVGTLLRVREVEILARWIGKALSREVSIAPVKGKLEFPAPLPPGDR